MERKPLKLTFDTNTLPIEPAMAALGAIPASVAVTSPTAREVEGTRWAPELFMLKVIPETWVMGESVLGVAVLGGHRDAELFEQVLTVITSGSFPKPGARGSLTSTQQRQMRDAMIFCTHVREGRDIFVTNDVKAFGEDGSSQRQRISALSSTRVMTMKEFEAYCKDLADHRS